MNKKKKKSRMAGEKIKAQGPDFMANAQQDVPAKQTQTAAQIDSTAGAPAQRDWSVANWDNPTKKERHKFKQATGYPQYLGGFRKGYRKDYMEDGQIDYYTDHKYYDKIYNQIGKKTGLTFNRVDNHYDAEIANFWSEGTSQTHMMPRKDRKGGTGKRYQYQQKSFEDLKNDFELTKNNPNAYIGGVSTAVNPKDYAKDYPAMQGIDDMHQTNRVNALRGSTASQRKAAWHEVGHSLGLKGDTTLTDKDPSVMSYNHDFNKQRLGKREYESIKRLHSQWL